MLPLLLIACGGVVLVVTLAVTRATRRAEDPKRLWPIAATLAGLVLVMGGLVAAQAPRAPEQEPPASAFSIEVNPPADAETPPAEPDPVVVAAATPRTPRPVSRTPKPPRTPSVRPPGGAIAPRPTPTPSRPGPALGASTSCFGGTISIEYTASARGGRKLTSLRLSLNGKVVQQPNVSGKSQHAGSFSTRTTRSSNSFSVTATQSDGGFTAKSFPVRCP